MAQARCNGSIKPWSKSFFGASRAPKDVYDHAHESPLVVLIPLGVLSLGAVLAGMVFYGHYVGEEQAAGGENGDRGAAHGGSRASRFRGF